jgi:transaldolase
LATAIFEPKQAFLAFKARASYLAPYLGRIADAGVDRLEMLRQMQAMKMHYAFKGKIMGAGIRELAIAIQCLELGISAVTLSETIFNRFIQDCEPTWMAINKFSQDWSQSTFYSPNFYALNL